MLGKDLCLKVIRHDFLFIISLSIHSSHLEAKKTLPSPQLSTAEHNYDRKNSTLPALKRYITECRGNYIPNYLSLAGSTNLRIFKGKGYVIHWSIWGKEVTLGRCSAPKNYCRHIHWQGHSAQWTSVTQNAFSNQSRTIRQKNKVNLLENNGKIILWADTNLKSS